MDEFSYCISNFVTVLDQQAQLQRSFIDTFDSVDNFKRMISQHKYREVCLNLLIFLFKAYSNEQKDFSEKLKKTKDLMNQYKIKSPQESQKVLVSLSSSRLTPQQIDSKLNQQLSELELNRSHRFKETKIVRKICESCQQELHHHCEICNQVKNKTIRIQSSNHVTQTLHDQIQMNSVAQKNQERLIQHIPESVLKLQEQIERTRGLQQKYQFTSSPPLNKDANKPIIIYQPIIYQSEHSEDKPDYYLPKTDSPQKHFKVMKTDKNRTNQCVKQNSEIFVQNRYTSPQVGRFREQDSSVTKSLDTLEEIMKHDQAQKITEQESKDDIKKQYTFNVIQRTELQTLADQLDPIEEPYLSQQVSEVNLLAVTPKQVQISSCIDLMKMNVIPQEGEKFKSNPTSPLKQKPQKSKTNDRFNETKRFFLDYMPPKKPHDIRQTQQRPFNIITNQ